MRTYFHPVLEPVLATLDGRAGIERDLHAQLGPWAPLGISVGFEISGRDSADYEALAGVHRSILEACRALGGRPYLAGNHALDESLKSQVYGESYRTHQRLRRECDPLLLFNSTTI